MTDETEKPDKNLSDKPWQFKKGYDPKRWMKGAPRKPKNKKKAEELLEHVVWEELSRMIENKETGESTDALRLMVRSMIRSSKTQSYIVDRIAGKVKDEIEHSGESKIELVVKYATDDKSAKTTPKTE